MVKPSISGNSPLSPTRWPADAFNVRAIAAFAALLIVAVATGVVISIVVFAGARMGGLIVDPKHPFDSPTARWLLLLSQVLLYVPIVFVLIRFLPNVAKRSLRELGLRRPSGREALTGVLGAGAMWLVVSIVAAIQYFTLHLKAEQQSVKLLATANDPVFLVGFALLAVVLAPFVEEFAFRGFVFNAFLRYVPVPVAALASGVVFGLGHLEPTAALPLAFGGVVLAYVYYSSGSLVASMIAHGCFNLVTVVLVIATGGKIAN